MKTEPNDELLDRSLHEWRVTAALPPRFQEQVWRRIAQEEAGDKVSLGLLVRNTLERLFARRAWAASYLAVALFSGMALSYWQVRSESASFDAGLSQRYVQSLDPYQKAGR